MILRDLRDHGELGRTAVLWLGLALGGCIVDARLGSLDGGSDEGAEDGSAADDEGDDGETDSTGSEQGDAASVPGLEPTLGAVAIVDCDVEAGYEISSWRATDPSSPRLWIGGVYETRSDHHAGHHPVGTGTVSWAVPGANVLVLGSYEPTDWTITVEPGGQLERVIATGHHAQTVQAPAGVAVEIHAYELGATDWACGHALPGDGGGGCEGEELVAFAQQATGLPVHAFDGCYHASRFEYLP